jgi:excisionase family DNA binding protein
MAEEEKLISIGEAASILGVSIDTLRRWDRNGKLKSLKLEKGHRRYYRSQLELYLSNLFSLAKDWVMRGTETSARFYCTNSAMFQNKLTKMQDLLAGVKELSNIFSLVTAVAGEIGNNSFDHNLGNWPDIPGIFFGYDIHKRVVVLADRGQGI